jgi:hypothetical protein
MSDERALASAAREIADVIRDWFSPHGTSTDEAMARIIVALERRGVLFFGERAPDVTPIGSSDNNVVKFPCRRRVVRDRR